MWALSLLLVLSSGAAPLAPAHSTGPEAALRPSYRVDPTSADLEARYAPGEVEVLREGTPVWILGAYDHDAPPPWRDPRDPHPALEVVLSPPPEVP